MSICACIAGVSERIQQRVLLGLFHEARDAVVVVNLHDAAGLGLVAPDRHRGDGDVRAGFAVLLDHLLKIHPIQLVAAQDEQVVEIVVHKVDEIFPHRVRRAFIPRCVVERLLRREDFHEAGGELVELVGARNVAVQRGGIELRQNVNAPEAGVDAVGNRDVHDAVFAGERHGGLGAVLRQRKQARALAAAHDDAENLAGVVGLPSGD